MTSLGKKIRSLRLKRNLTLVQLAGEQMSKGMLSLIENDKATPSMENLSYLAQQLDVPIAELLEEQITKEEALVDMIKKKIEEKGSLEAAVEEIWELFDPNFPLSDRLSGAQLAVYFGKSAYYKKEDCLPFFEHAENVYREFHTSDLWVDTVFQRLLLYLRDNRYEEALSLIEQKQLERQTLTIEPTPMRMIEWNFYLAAIQLALGAFQEGMETIEETLALSRRHHIYYMMNQLLRMATVVEMMTEAIPYQGIYLKKLKQYMQFSEDQDLAFYLPYIECHYFNTYDLKLEKAKEKFALINHEKTTAIYKPFIKLESGKLHYHEKNYAQALKELQTIGEIDQRHHPLDLSVIASRYTYLYFIAKAKQDADLLHLALNKGKKAFESLPDTFYKRQFENLILDAEKPS